jgi:cytochrome c553
MLKSSLLWKTPIRSIITVVFIILVLTLRFTQTAATQQKEPSREGVEFFEKKIRPVLADSCYACHSAKAKKPQGGLLLDSLDSMLKGGASGQPSIVPGDPEKSLLIIAIRYTDPKLQMPFGGKLPDQVIKDFEEWVKMGAPAPRGDATVAANRPSYNFDDAKKFWSYRPITDHRPPAVKNQSWVKTPIDRFILAKLEEKQLKPVGDADKRTLIRRATFDLTGLPPAPEEIEKFLHDKSPNAFEKVVDRLLASPAYGERWGRHWLDLVRYADTAGDNSDYPVPAAYRYRNYVIESFNKDKPYDRFIREQIAGDILASHRSPRIDGNLPDGEEDEDAADKRTTAEELEKSRQEKIIATGYLAMSRRFGSRNKEMNLTIDDTIDNLGKTFLGLSTSCARCHDHKFDPIPQRDYYALYGMFNSIRYSFPGAEIYPHPAEMVALGSGDEAARFYKIQKELESLDDRVEFLKVERGAAARNQKMKEDQAKKEAQAKEAVVKGETRGNNESAAQSDDTAKRKIVEPKGETRAADYDRDSNNSSSAQKSKRMPEDVEAEAKAVRARIAELHARYRTAPKAYAVAEGLAANARLHRKGDPKNLGEEAPRGFLTILGGQQVPKDHDGSGRELLADWIADTRNPLTARVMANRIWQYHFGAGIVHTSNDFGSRGSAPTHPELLDYLASRFIEGGWSMKKMHRMIMLSRVYQLDSGEERAGNARRADWQARLFAANAAIDVSNDFLWRFNRRRLSAEEVRDSMLSTSGQLDRSMGGEHPFPPETTWRFSQHVQFFGVYDSNRRSVYLMQQRLKKHPFFEVFDGADTNMTVGERPLSTTPLQALYLMNNPFVHEQADQFALRVGMAYDTMPERVNYAFQLSYGRSAKPEEVREAIAYIEKTKVNFQTLNIPREKYTRMALASYCRVLLSSNEFLYVD